MSVQNVDDFSETEQPGDSIIECFFRLKEGEAEAAQQLWNRYSSQLVRVAKQRLGTSPSGIGDEEDVAQSVFRSIFRGAAEGRFDQISTRDELWWLLLTITNRKAVDHIRREAAQKRGGQRHQPRFQNTNGEPAAWQFSLDELIGSSPTPDFLAELDEQYGRLLDMLRNDQLRRIAILRIDGYTVAEIAKKVGIGHRAVERKLQLIRSKWHIEIAAQSKLIEKMAQIEISESVRKKNPLLPAKLYVDTKQTVPAELASQTRLSRLLNVTDDGEPCISYQSAIKWAEINQTRLPNAAEYDAIVVAAQHGDLRLVGTGMPVKMDDLFDDFPELSTTTKTEPNVGGAGAPRHLRDMHVLKGFRSTKAVSDLFPWAEGESLAGSETKSPKISVRGVRSATPRFVKP